MDTFKEPRVGRFAVDVDLANDRDLGRAEDGRITPDQVRRVRIRGVVDSGATFLVIPESVAKQLGVETSGVVKVRYADGRTAERPVAGHVHLSYGGRDNVFSAIVEPNRDWL
jgi:predicted aspartyl protease